MDLSLAPPFPPRVRVYIFNATNPPGGRSTPEHNIQLMVPGQGRHDRADFDWSGDFEVLLVGKVEDEPAFVLWDARLHTNFANSSNVQVRTSTIQAALSGRRLEIQPRLLNHRTVEEHVIATPADLLKGAVLLRLTGQSDFRLADVPRLDATAIPSPSAEVTVGGAEYVQAALLSYRGIRESRVFEFDPNALDRGTRAHMELQNRLAEVFATKGYKPLSPAPGDPEFDLAARGGDEVYLVEVKSLTPANEDKQLRLGLGQLLSYKYQIEHSWKVGVVRAVLAVEHEPSDDHWLGLCAEHYVTLTWPDQFAGLF